MVSFRSHKKLEPRPDGLLQGLNLKFPTSIPVCSIWESPPPTSGAARTTGNPVYPHGGSSFTLERGVRQGDPLSPYLFLLAIETLAISIRENPEIDGIKIDKNETKLLQYADDTTAVLSNLNSAITLFQHLNLFKNVSGLEVNSSKTEGMWIGSLKSNEEKPFGIKWPSEPIKALGVFFTYDQTLLYEKKLPG